MVGILVFVMIRNVPSKDHIENSPKPTRSQKENNDAEKGRSLGHAVFGEGISVFYAATSSPFFAPGSPLEKYRSLFLSPQPVAFQRKNASAETRQVNLYSKDLERLREELIKNKLIRENEFTSIAGYDASEAFFLRVMDLQVVKGKLSLAQAEEIKASLKHKYDELRAGTYFAGYGYRIITR